MESTTPTPTASVTYEVEDGLTSPGGWLVSTTWSGEVDRKDGLGFLLPNEQTARRLERAINAGAVFAHMEIRTDVYGHTYVSAKSRVMGRYVNADLKRLGY